MTTLSGILDAYEASIKPDKPIPALQGAFIAGAYQTTVASDPSLVYVRMLDNTVTRAKHRNRLNLTDPNQNIPIALYYDEYDQLSVWGIEPNQAGAVLQGSPVAGAGGVKSVVAGTNITVDNTDPVNPIVAATGGASGGGAYFEGVNPTTLSVVTSGLTVETSYQATVPLPSSSGDYSRLINYDAGSGTLWSSGTPDSWIAVVDGIHHITLSGALAAGANWNDARHTAYVQIFLTKVDTSVLQYAQTFSEDELTTYPIIFSLYSDVYMEVGDKLQLFATIIDSVGALANGVELLIVLTNISVHQDQSVTIP